MSGGGLSGEDKVLELVGAIYDAALDAQLWPDKPPVWGVGCNTHILSGRRPFTRPRRSRRVSGFVQSCN